MSSGSEDRRNSRSRAELARELRQFTGLSAAFFRAAAARLGMTVTDLQVIDTLESVGPLTAGQLSDLTGLTTGAITGMLNRLEKSGLILKGSDPDDARRVLVRLAPGAASLRDVNATLDSPGMAWNDAISHYSDEQIALLQEFLKRGNALTREEIARLRAAPEGEEGMVSTPLGAVNKGQLIVTGSLKLAVHADAELADLYQARFEGVTPDVKSKDGEVTIRYPRRLLLMGKRPEAAEVTLNAAIPWRIAIQGAASEISAALGGLDLAGFEMKGAASMINLELPTLAAVVPVRISGDASAIIVRRPAGAAARVRLKGWVSTLVFDDQTFGAVGSDVRMQSHNFDAAAPYYDIEITSTASTITISTDVAADDATPRTR